MQLNYFGRYRSLRQFLNLFDTEQERLNNIIIGRLTDNWGSTIPVFDPSKTFFYDASNVKDGISCAATNKINHITLAAYLVSINPVGQGQTPTAPAEQITYNGQTYYALPVNKTNAQVLDSTGKPFLNLYLEFNFKVSSAGNEVTFRAIGFRDPMTDPTALSEANEVFCYEYVNPQTVNAGDGLTLKLVLAF